MRSCVFHSTFIYCTCSARVDCSEAAKFRHQLAGAVHRRSTIRQRAFPIADADVWNDLPSDVMSAPLLAVFGWCLKNFFAAATMLPDCSLLL